VTQNNLKFVLLGPEEFPTLLHFAARNGLEKLAWQLLECPGGEYACEIRNACELTPAELAEAAGHSKLANALRGYMVTIFSHHNMGLSNIQFSSVNLAYFSKSVTK
jgi:hypothetical protein